MILVDTAVWITHLQSGNGTLLRLLADGEVLGHPLVTGELSVGNIVERRRFLRLVDDLPSPVIASDDEVRHFLEMHHLFGRGVGFVDLHLLLSVRLTPETLLWTRDKRLHAIAVEMSLAFNEPIAATQ